MTTKSKDGGPGSGPQRSGTQAEQSRRIWSTPHKLTHFSTPAQREMAERQEERNKNTERTASVRRAIAARRAELNKDEEKRFFGDKVKVKR